MATNASESPACSILSSTKRLADFVQSGNHLGLLKNRPGREPLEAAKLKAAKSNIGASRHVQPFAPSTSSSDVPDESDEIKKLLSEVSLQPADCHF
jgi:hypothetical protein